MAKIVELAKIAKTEYLGATAPFLEIESEFQKLESRIEGLEKKVAVTKTAPEEPPQDGPALDFDRYGEPKAGLEPGDVISYEFRTTDGGNQSVLGQFVRILWDNRILGDWVYKNGKEVCPTVRYTVAQSRVTFEFRPKKEA